MDEKDFNNEPVTEEDYDLFYGFVDSIFEEKKQHEEGEKETSLSTPESEWSAEPFEEFIVGVPQPDNGKYYSLNIVSPDRAALPGDIHPNHYGTISGMIISITLCAAFLFTVYFLTSEPEPKVVSNEHLDNIEQSIRAVENNMQSVNAMITQIAERNSTVPSQENEVPHSAAQSETASTHALESQIQTMVSQLDRLNSTMGSPLAINNIVPNGRWVINVASFRSKQRAQTLLEDIQSIHLPVEMFTATVKGTQWVRVRIPSFNSRLKARQFMLELAKLLPDTQPWVSPR